MSTLVFAEAYKKLNTAQRDAVDSIDGPVMVVAGPGTGKTQILALRIGNILEKTDTHADGILCLTFTNSGVRAMRERLMSYIGSDASKVKISTFHSFALDLIERHYPILDFEKDPELIDDTRAITIADEILETNDWEHLRPRGNSTQYFYDIKSLIALLSRERITPEEFLKEIEHDIKMHANDSANISSRGESKGSLKKEITKKIESLERTREVVRFYELYVQYKKEHSLIDYDDALRLLVELVTVSEDVASELRENFLYVLVDEHQDSSGIQNQFLEAIWKEIDKPNIFVVGDDRQLIYGFGGASLSYFENFKTAFGKAKLITLVENYRSSQDILNVADALLSSSLTKEKLKSNTKHTHPIVLHTLSYPRDEILRAGIDIKKYIKEGVDPNECAILVPKNAQVRNAVTILRDMGIPVAAGTATDLFLSSDALAFINVLRILKDPFDQASIALHILSRYCGISPLQAHAFLQKTKARELSIETLITTSVSDNLFSLNDPITVAGKQLSEWLSFSSAHSVYETIQYIGEELLLKNSKEHDELTTRAEVIRTFLHLSLSLSTRSKEAITLTNFLDYLDRLKEYGEHIPLAVFGKNEGVKVMTLHGSKGLEFDFVWIAHVDEKSLFSGKRSTFTLPEKIEHIVEVKDDEVVKRQVYVAITRAKRYCNVSYALENYNGAPQELTHIFADIPDGLIEKKSEGEGEATILADDPTEHVKKQARVEARVGAEELAAIVKDEYEKTKVSVTLLNNFFECPWKWYFRNLLKLPEIKSASQVFGSVIHECVEKLLGDESKSSEKDLKQMISASLLRNNIIDPNETRRMMNEAFAILSRFVKTRLSGFSKNRTSEQPFSYKDSQFPNLVLYGKIDLVARYPDDEIHVTDFKTGSAKTKSMIEKETEEGRPSDYLRQLIMYTYLIQGAEKPARPDGRLGGKHSIIKSYLEFIEADPSEKDAIYSTAITTEQIDLLKRDISDYDTLLKNGEWIRRPCNYNSYGKNTECEYCEKAKIYKSN